MPTLTLQPAGLDTMIKANVATTNFGTDITLEVGELTGNAGFTRRTLIKPDLSALPSDATITSAILSLRCTTDFASSATTYRVYRVKRAWVEAEATWNIFSTGNNWSTAGGFHADDCEQTDIGSRAFTATETLMEFKDFVLTPTTKAALDLGFGFMIKADLELNDGYRFNSADHTTGAERPKLVIIYTEAGGADDYKPQTLVIGGQFGVQMLPAGGAGLLVI